MNEDSNQLQPNEPQKTKTNTPILELGKSETEQMAPLATPVAVHHKNIKKPLVVILVLLVSIVSAAVAYWYNNRDYILESNTSEITAIREDLNARSAPPKSNLEVMVEGFSKKINGSNIKGDVSAPDYNVVGYDFNAVGIAEESSALVISVNEKDVATTLKKVETVLLSKGFKKSVSQVAEALNDSQLTKYEQTGLICGISNVQNNPTLELVKFDVQLACAEKRSYEKIAKTQQPFYEAYRRDDVHGGKRSVGYPTISAANSNAYKTATAAIYDEAGRGGALGLFYQTPDEKWHYFLAAQAELDCASYNTEELKKAYQGATCSPDSNGGRSTVQP